MASKLTAARTARRDKFTRALTSNTRLAQLTAVTQRSPLVLVLETAHTDVAAQLLQLVQSWCLYHQLDSGTTPISITVRF